MHNTQQHTTILDIFPFQNNRIHSQQHPHHKPKSNTHIVSRNDLLPANSLLIIKSIRIALSNQLYNKCNQIYSNMFNKFAHSQTTLTHSLHPRSSSPHQDNQTLLKNPFKQTLPLKFPKNPIVKPCQQHMLSQTTQKHQPSSVRVYVEHNRSRFFEGSPLPLSQTQILSKHPQYLFDSYHQRKLSNAGDFAHLARESIELPIRMRTYQDIGVTNNQKRIFSNLHYKPDPIILGQKETRFNSSLDKVWQEPRRHRDNGLECQKVLQSSSYLKKRQPYGGGSKNSRYSDAYKKGKGIKAK